MTTYTFSLNPYVTSGPGPISPLQSILKGLDKLQPLSVTDHEIANLDLPQKQQYGLSIGALFDDVAADPTVELVESALKRVRNAGAEVILAVSDGSTIGTAKLAAFLATHEHSLQELAKDRSSIGSPGIRALLLIVELGHDDVLREKDWQVERCLNYIHEHYTSSFSFETLAQTISVSPSYLFRIFKRRMRVTPMHYRNLLRIDKAKLLLLNRRLTMKEIAWHVGFEDDKYFSRVFKKETGSSPHQFRTMHLAGRSRFRIISKR